MIGSYQEQKRTKFVELEGLRGLAALLIVFHHIPPWHSVSTLIFIKNGYLMVPLFFVLSGFVIYNAYYEKITTVKELIRFQFLRLGRLYPVHLTFLLIFLFIEIAKYYAKQQLAITSPNSEPFHENNIIAFVENVLLLQAVGPTDRATTFNGPAWSISVEFYTYLLFGLFVLYSRKLTVIIFPLVSLTSLYLLVSGNGMGFELLLSCIIGFFFGATTASLGKKIKGSCPKFLPLLSVLAILFFIQYRPSRDYDPFIYLLTALLILTLLKAKNNYVNRVLRSPALKWLGTMSYSIYMSHACIIWIINVYLLAILKKPLNFIEGRFIPKLSGWEAFATYFIVLIAVIFISTLVYKYIEQPFRFKSRDYAFSR